MTCKNCSATITDESTAFCPNCGNPLEPQDQPVQSPVNPTPYTQQTDQAQLPYQQPVYQQPYPPQENPDDKGGCLWGGLCFLVPVVGLILYLIWRKEKPKTARACGIGALVSVILSVVVCIVGSILVAVLGTSMAVGLSGFAANLIG